MNATELQKIFENHALWLSGADMRVALGKEAQQVAAKQQENQR